MPTSQFTIYTSEDRYGPGLVNGLTGSLLAVLNACLVNGYGTGSYYKAPAGWLKPGADSGSVYGLFQQPSGSGFTLFVNDNAPVGGSEAWFTGWQYTTSSAPLSGITPATHVGSGYGQFPFIGQGVGSTLGYLICRKSNANNSTPHTWIIAADAYTMYMWTNPGDNANYYQIGFGDFYSLKGTADKWRCLILGKYATGAGGDWTDALSNGAQYPGYYSTINSLQTGLVGHYIAASSTGTGGSLAISKKGDTSVCNDGFNTSVNQYAPMYGVLAAPNPVDNAFHFAPLWVVEPTAPTLRGRWRGIYQGLHPTVTFSNGQTIIGSGDYSGKTFMAVVGGQTGGYWILETSPTVDTN